MSISTLKWPEFEIMAPSFISSKCFLGQNVLVAGDGADTSPSFAASVIDMNAETVHHGSSAFVDRFGDNDLGASAACARS